MRKGNENIHLHIIEEDYRNKQKAKEQKFDVSGKSDTLTQLVQDHQPIATELEKLHSTSAAPENHEKLQEAKQLELPKQTCQSDIDKPVETLSNSEILSSIQEMKSYEQQLLTVKQTLLNEELVLRNKMTQEYEKKKKEIKDLKSEILVLVQSINEISGSSNEFT